MTGKLQDKVAIVTGAASGFGHEVDAATRVVNSGYRKDNANINFEDFGNHSSSL